MKKFCLFLMAALAVMATSCGSKNQQSETTEAPTSKHIGEAFESSINIRYVDMDTVMAHYIYSLEVQTQVTQLDMEYQNRANQYSQTLQMRQNQIQSKYQNNGYLSPQSLESDMQQLESMHSTYTSELSRLNNQSSAAANALLTSLNDSIEHFIADYNKEHHYDAILFRSAGLYFNPSLDITQEVINGLNARYNASAAPAAKPAAEAPAAKPAETPAAK